MTGPFLRLTATTRAPLYVNLAYVRSFRPKYRPRPRVLRADGTSQPPQPEDVGTTLVLSDGVIDVVESPEILAIMIDAAGLQLLAVDAGAQDAPADPEVDPTDAGLN